MEKTTEIGEKGKEKIYSPSPIYPHKDNLKERNTPKRNTVSKQCRPNDRERNRARVRGLVLEFSPCVLILELGDGNKAPSPENEKILLVHSNKQLNNSKTENTKTASLVRAANKSRWPHCWGLGFKRSAYK